MDDDALTAHLGERYLRDADLATRYQVHRSTIWRRASRGDLPQPVRISDGCVRWKLSEILEHEASRDRGGRSDGCRQRAGKAGREAQLKNASAA